MAEKVRNPSNQVSQSADRGADSGNGDARVDAGVSRGAGAQLAQLPPRSSRGDSHSVEWRAESLLQDVRFALRTLRKSWGFTVTAILTLALGIGANAAIFQLLDAVRLRSLPVPHPETLAGVQVENGTRSFGITMSDNALTYPLWEQIRLHQQVFSEVSAWADSGSASLGEGAQERRARGPAGWRS